MSTFEEELERAETTLEVNYLIIQYKVASRYDETIQEFDPFNEDKERIEKVKTITTENLRYAIYEDNFEYFSKYFSCVTEDNVEDLFEEICEYKRANFLKHMFQNYHHPYYSQKIFLNTGCKNFIETFIEWFVAYESYYSKSQYVQIIETIIQFESYGNYLISYIGFCQVDTKLHYILESKKVTKFSYVFKNFEILRVIKNLFDDKEFDKLKPLIKLQKIPNEELINNTTKIKSQNILKYIIKHKVLNDLDEWVNKCIINNAIKLLEILEQHFEIFYTSAHLKLSLKSRTLITNYLFQKGYRFGKEYIPLIIKYGHNDILEEMIKEEILHLDSSILLDCIEYKNYTAFKWLVTANVVINPYNISIFMKLQKAEEDRTIILSDNDNFWEYYLAFGDSDLFDISTFSEEYLESMREMMSKDLDNYLIKDLTNIIEEYI